MKKILPILLSAFLLTGCSSSKSAVSLQDRPAQSNDNIIQKSLKDLLSSGLSQKCTWSATEENTSIKGEILIKGNKFKQVSSVKTEQSEMTINAVSDGEWIYTWNDQVPGQGIKMNLKQSEITPMPDQTDNSQINFEKQYNYSCTPASVSDSDVTVPKDINFSDMSETVKQFQKDFKNIDIEQLKKSVPGQ